MVPSRTQVKMTIRRSELKRMSPADRQGLIATVWADIYAKASEVEFRTATLRRVVEHLAPTFPGGAPVEIVPKSDPRWTVMVLRLVLDEEPA